MNLKRLFEMQRELDSRIEAEHGIVRTDSLLDKKVLALLVEVGELANETRCFKFWSSKGPSEKEVVLEEYADGLHFVLSIGLFLGFEDKLSLKDLNVSRDLSSQFLHIYQLSNELKFYPSINKYNELFSNYLLLGKQLKFSLADIEAAYLSKNQVNHVRQDEGY